MTDQTAESDYADRLRDAVMERVGATTASGVQCPRERSFMTPCVARDGALALADDDVCVGCGTTPSEEYTRLSSPPGEDASC